MQGPTLWFSMIGKGGPLCARGWHGPRQSEQARKTETDFLAIVWWFINRSCTTTKHQRVNFKGVGQECPTHNSLSAHQGGAHFHGLEQQPHGRDTENQAYCRPGNKRAHGLPR